MVECLVWDQDAAGSTPVTSTSMFFYMPLSEALFRKGFSLLLSANNKLALILIACQNLSVCGRLPTQNLHF